MRQLATQLTPKPSNCNQWSGCNQLGSVVFLVQPTGPSNTSCCCCLWVCWCCLCILGPPILCEQVLTAAVGDAVPSSPLVDILHSSTFSVHVLSLCLCPVVASVSHFCTCVPLLHLCPVVASMSHYCIHVPLFHLCPFDLSCPLSGVALPPHPTSRGSWQWGWVGGS